MSTALQLQFFMVQVVNYSVIIVKKVQKPIISQTKKRLQWCELINPYNFCHCQCVLPYVTKNVSASVSEAATSRLGLGSEGLVHIPDVHTICTSQFWSGSDRRKV